MVVTFQSCDQIQTLQTYYVDKELDPGFMAWDVPPTIINIEDLELTEAQEEAYKSIEKLSLLTFLKEESNQEAYDLEIAKVKAILDDSKYEELMRGGNSTDGKFVIKCLASEGEDVDEFILFGNSNETGFAVVRIIGDDMNFSKIMGTRICITRLEF